jgi:hypothetical protein
VAPELALAKLELRQICLLAAFDILGGTEQAAVADEYTEARAAGWTVIDAHATTHEHGLTRTARIFLACYFVAPNTGLAGPFFAGRRRPIWELALVAAAESIRSGRSARVELHARLWDHICDADHRRAATRAYIRDRALLSFPPSAGTDAIVRYCRRVETLLTTSESVPALLATWAIEQNPRRLDDLGRPDIRDKHGLLEQRAMAPFLGMAPNALSQSLKRLKARLGEEMRVLWDIERIEGTSEDGS